MDCRNSSRCLSILVKGLTIDGGIMAKYCGVAKLHIWSFGLAFGIVWGLSLLIIAWIGMKTGLGVPFVETIRTVYVGYSATAQGIIWGGVWGFTHMFVVGVILAAIYNFFVLCFCRKCQNCSNKSDIK